MSGRSILLTYATPDLAPLRDALVDSALKHGFDQALALGPDDLAGSAFAEANATTLAQPRGAGYWLWKPYIIRRALVGLADADVLLYCDAGRSPYYRFTRHPRHLLDTARRRGFLTGVSIPQHGPLRRWTKRDCLRLLAADAPAITDRPLIQATWSAWTRTPAALNFLDAWLHHAQDPRCLTDQPNTLGNDHPDFVDHRHDQSIASLLAYQTGAPYLDLAATPYARPLSARPRSGLAHRFLKRPQDADAVIARRLPATTLLAAQARLWLQ